MIRLIAIGKNKDKALQSLEKEYCKRLSAFVKMEVIEVKEIFAFIKQNIEKDNK